MELLDKINTLTPLAVIGLLSYVVYLLVSKHGPVKTIANNHLHSLPDMMSCLSRIEATLGEIRDGINFLKGQNDRRGRG